MAIKAVLFDLDGTLLPMDQDAFTKSYFTALAKRLALLGYEPGALIDAILKGTEAMIQNDGKRSNEAVFWVVFAGVFGEKAREDKKHFEQFYRTDFQSVRSVCGFEKRAAETVRKLRGMKLQVALATNPIFPSAATRSRIHWAGLLEEDFELYTTYENSVYCKPNPLYYKQIALRLGVRADECLMVGNDVNDDMAARDADMHVFLLSDWLINKGNCDISIYPNGSYEQLDRFISELLE